VTDQLSNLSSELSDRYQVERELGAGGMATVYLALDLRHQRPVAIKVIRPDLAAVLGADRFLHEIRVTANLQHPNILPLFDSGSAGGSLYYVMPYVNGESLRQRLQREKQLPVEEAVRIVTEVAGALDYAHRRGLIHRDIKPENVLLQEGRALVADFGIALAVQTAGGSRLTESGLALGTPSYMSPEQATGDRQLDARTDVYSLGCVAYEMLAGEPPHQGPTLQAIMARVMTETPRPLAVTRPAVPPNVAAAVHRALQRAPADRFQAAAEFAAALVRPMPSDSEAKPSRLADPRILVALAATAAIAFVAGMALGRGVKRPPRIQERVELYLGTDSTNQIDERFAHPVRISRDGRRIVYVGKRPTGTALFLRNLGDRETRRIQGTDGASTPAFSPGGDSVAFFADQTIRKVAVSGGAPVTVVTDVGVAETFDGLDWGTDGRLVYTAGRPGGMFSLSSAGGTSPQLVAAAAQCGIFRFAAPALLPGGRAVLAQCGSEIFAVPRVAGAPKRLGVMGTSPRFAAGRMLYRGTDGTLFAQPFDPGTLTVSGDPSAISGDVERALTGQAEYDISESGSLVHVVRGTATQIAMLDAGGTERVILTGEDAFYPRFSPEGDRIAYTKEYPTGGELWASSLVQGTAQRLVHEGLPSYPSWSPDGRRILFSSFRAGEVDLWSVGSDGGEPKLLFGGPRFQQQPSLTRDGKWITFVDSPNEAGADLAAVNTAPNSQAEVLLATPFLETQPTVSPDGRWLAYVSNESGTSEVYIRPFRREGGRRVISVGGGDGPVWSWPGTAIYYRHGTQLIIASLGPGDPPDVRERRILFDRPNDVVQLVNRHWDVSPDGSKFVFVTRPGERQIVVTLGALQPD
jgi:serine/threonine-protein kinase